MGNITKSICKFFIRNKAKCNHKYHLYNIGTYSPLFSTNEFMLYQFACKYCGTECDISSDELRSELLEEKRLYNKQKMMGEIEEHNANSTITFKTFSQGIATHYEGNHVGHIKSKYLSRGINLDEITESTMKW